MLPSALFVVFAMGDGKGVTAGQGVHARVEGKEGGGGGGLGAECARGGDARGRERDFLGPCYRTLIRTRRHMRTDKTYESWPLVQVSNAEEVLLPPFLAAR